jgi:K+-transporting ATPase KdpF subunit
MHLPPTDYLITGIIALLLTIYLLVALLFPERF